MINFGNRCGIADKELGRVQSSSIYLGKIVRDTQPVRSQTAGDQLGKMRTRPLAASEAAAVMGGSPGPGGEDERASTPPACAATSASASANRLPLRGSGASWTQCC